jgi:hypothetical protein
MSAHGPQSHAYQGTRNDRIPLYKTMNELSAGKNRETDSPLSGLIADVRIYGRTVAP